ncbi:hypothetical protein KUTeg_015395 [Tegillarca granosa]|uniref:Uncharacterized protein n=1 Tax=Tegillarca granosa TaxID=220873 RepID=A0ABQ9EPZ8_TEGGR|nr:hypothetical protein KUTeg_015395 [Tegillarca granosa]
MPFLYIAGTGDRREIQAFPKDSEKKGLEWIGEDGFHQLVKAHGGKQQYYPIPPKTVAPNIQERPPELQVSERTANAMRNVERDQWQTTYDLNHTGIGPSNPKKLDNLEDKIYKANTYGIEDDNLYPNSINEFDPPRPFEGRLARKIIPRPPPQRADKSADETPGYIRGGSGSKSIFLLFFRKQTLHEVEEDRLHNGRKYVNLPETLGENNKHTSLRWKELNDTAHPIPGLENLQSAKEGNVPDDIPYPPVEGATEDNYENYLQTSKDKKDEEIQEMEAQNRFRVLEAHKPNHDISSLNHKYGHVLEREQPSTFYGHEGKYNEERAGLYRTSYLPERLAHSMNDIETSGPEIMNTLHSHVDALGLPVKLNRDLNDAMRYSRTFTWQQPNLSGDRRDPREVLQPMQELKNDQKRVLQPSAENARA